jgi:hypothetical protein
MRNYAKLSSAAAKDIRLINVRTNLVYYLLWKVDAMDELHTETKERRRNPAYFDIETNKKIASFVKECIEIYNQTHKKVTPWTFTEMMYFLKFVWQKETKDYLDAKNLTNKL